MTNKTSAPHHIAIVMDGNGRWAKKRLLPRSMGHKAGADATQRIVTAAAKAGVKVLTLFAFSSENWQRPVEEVNDLMTLFLTRLEKKLDELNQQGIRLRFIGAVEALNADLQKRFAEAEQLTKNNSLVDLVVAVNYGGQWDIVQACKKVYAALDANQLTLAELTPEKFSQRLSTENLPPPDLFIRTSGELRISNFLLWQLAYTELYFTDVLWPDFDEEQLQLALDTYALRKRRFGKTGEVE